MKLLETKTEEHQVYLTAEAEPEEVEKALDKAYRKLVEKVDVPGFRKGKAPRDVLELQVGKDNLFNDAAEDFVAQACLALVQDNNIPVYARPQVTIKTREPLVFEVVIPQPPDVTMGDIDTIKMKPEPVDIKDEEVDAVIDRLRKQFATWETADRPAQMFDLLVISVDSHADGVPFMKESSSNFQLMPDMSFPAPGFNDQLVDMKAGDEKEFTLTLAESYSDKTFAGKDIAFKVTLHEVKREVLPELDIDFAKKLSADFEDVAQVRSQIKDDLEARGKERSRVSFEDKVVDALVDLSEIEYPPLLIDLRLTTWCASMWAACAARCAPRKSLSLF